MIGPSLAASTDSFELHPQWHPLYQQPGPKSLTPRELEVLELTVEGLTSREIGRRLGISPRTADAHRSHLIHKLGFRNRCQVIRYAITSGLVDAGAVR